MAKFTNVLLIEDDPITIMVCDRIIKMTDFATNVISLQNGKYAIDYMRQIVGDGAPHPEVIFLDINMPVMNGWDFLEEFEELQAQLSLVPQIFILSSTVDPEDYKRAKSYSAVKDFISKPLSKEFLEKIHP